MKNLVISAALGALLLLPACDLGGDGTLSSCVTGVIGTFDGDRTGQVIGSLTYDGTLNTTFYFEGMDTSYSSKTAVGEDGSLTAGEGSLDLLGTYDFDSCSGSGTWEIGSNFSGTWEVRTREDSL